MEVRTGRASWINSEWYRRHLDRVALMDDPEALLDRLGPLQCLGCGFCAEDDVGRHLHRLQCHRVLEEDVASSIEHLVRDLSWIPTMYANKRLRYLLAVEGRKLAKACGYRRVETWVRERIYPEPQGPSLKNVAPIDLPPGRFRAWLKNTTMRLARSTLEELLGADASERELKRSDMRRVTAPDQDRVAAADDPEHDHIQKDHRSEQRRLIDQAREAVERGAIALSADQRALFHLSAPPTRDASAAELQAALSLPSEGSVRIAKHRLLRKLAASIGTKPSQVA
jgi:tRNA U55 pseudouridine synthase TruB